MSPENKLPPIPEIKYAVAAFNQVLDPIFAYDIRKGHGKHWFRKLAQNVDIWENFPENWEGQVQGVLSGLSVMGQRSTAAAFSRAHGDQLPPEERNLVKLWKQYPWRMAAFRVVQKLDNDMVEISLAGIPPVDWHPDLDWESQLLYSPALWNRNDSPSTLILTLLWRGPHTWHTYGPIFSLSDFQEEDLHYILDAEAANQRKGKTPILLSYPMIRESLMTRLSRSPVTAELCFQASEKPGINGPFGPLRSHVSFCKDPLPPEITSEAWWKSLGKSKKEKIGSMTLLETQGEVYLGKGNSLKDPWFLFDEEKALIYLCAWSLEAYDRGRKFMEDHFKFPPAPMRCHSLLAGNLCEELFPEVWDGLGELGEDLRIETDPEEDEESVNPELDTTKSVLDRIMVNHNEGIQESPAEIARALGLPLEKVSVLWNQLKHILPKKVKSPIPPLLDLPPRVVRGFNSPGVMEIPGYLELNLEPSQRHGDLLDLLEGSPILHIFRWLVDISLYHGGRIPATAAGYVNTKILAQAWESFGNEDPEYLDLFLPKKESDWPWFMEARKLLERAGFLELDKGGFRLRQEAAENLEKPLALWMKLFEAALNKWNWIDETFMADLVPGMDKKSLLFLYTLGFLSDKSSQKERWIDLNDLSRVYLESLPPDHQKRISTMPAFYEDGPGGVDQFLDICTSVIHLLVLKGPLELMGLSEIRLERRDYTGEIKIRPTELCRRLYTFGPQ